MIEIVESGVLTTVQDHGRPGRAHIGVPESGAVDRALAARCNRVVGNIDDAAVLETVGGLRIRAVSAVTVATDVESVARSLGVGDEIELGVGGRQWHYVAVRGGIDVSPVLGSRSTDTLSGLGPPPVRTGDRYRTGAEPSNPPIGDVAPVRTPDAIARVEPGPRLDWFATDTLDWMRSRRWTIGAASRVGLRLIGEPMPRVRHDELPSEGLVRGSIQVPPDGAPIMMLADHPTTGGYPVVAVVHPDDVATVAQLMAGSVFRFG